MSKETRVLLTDYIASKMAMRDSKDIPVVHLDTPDGKLSFARLPNGNQVQWRVVPNDAPLLATLPQQQL